MSPSVAEPDLPDPDLLDAWRGGDTNAGKRLFDRHADAVARFFENKVRLGADDLTQGVFLAMLEGRDRIREGGSFRAFIFGIARNVLRVHLRELARGHEVDPDVDSMAALAPGPSTVVGLRQEHQLMLEGLRRLSITDQILLELFYWENLRAYEIGELLGIPPGTVRRQLMDTRAKLDAMMAQIAASPELLASTTRNLDSWVSDVRAQLGARPEGRRT